MRTAATFVLAIIAAGMSYNVTPAHAVPVLARPVHAPTLPGGARDVVSISAAPAGPAITVRFSNGAIDQLNPCIYEDGRQCYWDAGEMGNGRGHSFIVARGRLHYVDHIPHS